MQRNRFAEFVLLLNCATALCLALVFVLWTEEEGRSLFGSIGYCGALIFLATGACLDVEHRGGMGRLLRWGISLLGVVVIAFALAGVPVALSPRAGDPGFDPHAFCLVLFSIMWKAFQLNLAGLVMLIALASTRGWAEYLAARWPDRQSSDRQSSDRQSSDRRFSRRPASRPRASRRLGVEGPRRRAVVFRLLMTGYLGFVVVGCFVVTPGYTFPLVVRLMSGGFLVGIVLASDGQARKRGVAEDTPGICDFSAQVASIQQP